VAQSQENFAAAADRAGNAKIQNALRTRKDQGLGDLAAQLIAGKFDLRP
jgi:hypothetical protein